MDFSFDLVDLEKKFRRKFSKVSKYDPIITKFCEGTFALCQIDALGKNANYVRLRLSKRIDARGLDKQITISVVNNIAYLKENV